MPVTDRLSPAGSVPEASDHVYAGVPPVAVKVWEYALPTTPAGSGDAVEITSAGLSGLIVKLKDFSAIWTINPLSVALTVKLKDPAEVGVPLSTPLAERLSPPGRAPATSAHRYGVVPPVAENV